MPIRGTQYISKLEFQSTMKIKNMYVRKFSKNIANWEKKKNRVENSTIIQYDLMYLNIKTKLFVSI